MLTFVASASILVLEIAASRLVAPFVGNSLTVYTSIIGIILAGIALGAWAGGRLSDRVPPVTLLGPTFVLGGRGGDRERADRRGCWGRSSPARAATAGCS